MPIKQDAKTSNVPKQNLPKLNEFKPKIEQINGVTKKQNLPSSSSSYKNPGPSRYNSPALSGLNSGTNELNTATVGLNSASDSLSSLNRPGTSTKNDVNGSSAQNGAIPRTKRTNDQPQVNTAGDTVDKVKKDLW